MPAGLRFANHGNNNGRCHGTGDRRGADVVVHGRNAERGVKTVQEIENAGGKARFVAADLNSADDVRRLAAAAGPVDILINNAGI